MLVSGRVNEPGQRKKIPGGGGAGKVVPTSSHGSTKEPLWHLGG